MARAPFQILVYPYHMVDGGQFEYALLRRADANFWQGIAGGGEDNESPLEAAKRETYEESGISPTADFIKLDTTESIPVTEFRDSHLWGESVYVIPQYCFGVSAQNAAVILSHEHVECKWLTYEEALRSLKFDGDKTALWELEKRLKRKGPRE